MGFGFTGVTSTDTISMPFFFDAADAAGNRVSVANPLIVWWMPPDTFEGRMSGNTTADNPTFEWNLVRGETPQDANPAYPIARFRLFRSGDPSSSDPPWISVSDWGPWIALDVVTVQTFIGPNLRLGDALRNLPETQGVEVLLAAQMADEAGNLMPISDGVVNLGLDPVTVPDANSFDLIGNYGVPFKTWLNGAVESGYETSIDYRVWYNNTNDGNLRQVEPGASEVNFGNAKRVPILPEDNCDQRIEVQFLVNADFPVPSEATALSGVEWALYEDSRLVANGNMRLSDLGTTPLTFPTDLFEGGQGNVFVPLTIQRDGLATAVSTRAFLNDAPSDCGNFADRFGDDGDTPRFRRREVEYTFVAYATAEVGSPNAPRDQTPATVQFSVYVDDDAGPGTTPVKVFTNQ
jgi:hypothetical protein